MAEAAETRFRRLLLLVPFVLAHPGASVDEVCERFAISRKVLAEDLNVLFFCGLPGYSPGDLIEAYIDGDRVIIRAAEYFSRPLRLTSSEGLLLYAGARALASSEHDNDALAGALEKLKTALGPDVVARIDVGMDASAEMGTIKRAINEGKKLHLVYQSQSKDEITERDVDPWALLGSSGKWYLVAWCNTVNDERIFRLDRIKTLELLDTPADVRTDLDLEKYADLYVESPDSIHVGFELAPGALWVLEYYPLISADTLEDGWTRVGLSAGGTAWLERLLLRLGTQARAIDPPEISDAVKERARKLLARYR